MNAQLRYADKVLKVDGDITFETVQSLHRQLCDLQGQLNGDICCQLQGVRRIDTSSLAFCLSIERLVKNKAQVSYDNVPKDMLSIAKSVGVYSLFELS
jgi:ABC-type transporter Mla MlaB component